ncbi:MAG: tetratricopeptide repeat protein [Myxococcota bacterium]
MATILAYGSFHGFAFLNFDDDEYVSANPHVLAGLTADSLRWALTATHANNWHPLTWLSHMLDIELFGADPVWHHRTSLALHVATTLVLFLALRRMTGSIGRSGFVAGLFALHPMHVESVAWIAERKDVLSALCFAGVLLLYARYAERPSRLRYAGLLATFAAGLAAKPMLVTLPALLLLLDVWPLRRLPVSPRLDLRRLGALVIEKLPLVALSAASSAITLAAQSGAIELGSRHAAVDRLGNALVSCVRYLAGTLVPAQLSIAYAHPGAWPPAQVLGCALVLAAITVGALRARATRPYLVVGWLWFLGMLVPVIGVIQVGEQAMADRYTYLPSLGLFVMVAWGIPSLLPERPWCTRALAVAAVAVLAVYGVLTRAQVEHWRSSTALWEHALDVDPRSSLALRNLGQVAQAQDRRDDALALYRRAVEVDPRSQNAHYRLGQLLVRMGRSDEALASLREAVRLRPDFAVAWTSLGYAYGSLGDAEQSLQAFQRSVEIDPSVASSQYELGSELIRAGRARDALGPLNEALRLRPDLLPAQMGLADAHAALGDRAAEIGAFERALVLAQEQGYPEIVNQIERYLERVRGAPIR